MKKDNPKKPGNKLDKVLMGAIIGGAIGSVLGATMAPKKGKETRKEIVEVAKKAKEKSFGLFKMIKGIIKKEKEAPKDHKKIPKEM